MKSKKVLFLIFLALALAIDVFIIVESCVGGSGSESQSRGITQMIIDVVHWFNPTAYLDVEYVHHIVRKVFGHFLLFGLSGIFTTLSFLMIEDVLVDKKKDIIVVSLFAGIFLAVGSEIIQLFTPGRFGDPIDILIDISGYILFGAITFVIFYLIYIKKKKKVSK